MKLKLAAAMVLAVVGMRMVYAADSTSAPAATKPVKVLAIVKAVYGDLPSGEKFDVTDKVKAMVKDNELTVDASNENFDDPASGVIKKLQVEYTVDGVKKTRVVPERTTLVISPNAPEPTKLIIKKAVWGDIEKGKTVDVTELLQGIEVKEAINVAASVDIFSDPAPDATARKLKVDYVLNGKEKSVTINEGDTLDLKGE